MIIEVFYILIMLSFGLFLIAEIGKKSIFGVIASITLLACGSYLLADDLQIPTGEIVAYEGSDLTTGNNSMLGLNNATFDADTNKTTTSLNQTTLINETLTLGRNETKTNTYSDVPTTSHFDVVQLIGIVLLMAGISGTYLYVFNIRNE